MRGLLQLFILLCSLSTLAAPKAKKAKKAKAKPLYTYGYSDKAINFNMRQYNRYIEPQLTAIVDGFYAIIEKSHPEQKHVLEFRRNFKAHSSSIKKIYKKCFNISFDCEKTDWATLHTKLLELSQLIYGFRIGSDEIKTNQEFFMDTLLTFQSKVRMNISKHLKNFESQYVTGKLTDNLLSEFTQFDNFTKTNLDLLMTGTIDKNNYQLFYNLWKNFVFPIEEGLAESRSIEILKKELVDLNVQWNNFHFQVDRKHFNVPKDISRTIKNIHRRWTNILKIIVG
jgi:hypothetical protein